MTLVRPAFRLSRRVVLTVGCTLGAASIALLLAHGRASPSEFQCSRSDVETAHGIVLPDSARQFQQLRLGSLGTLPLLDHGVLSLFEVDQAGLSMLIHQLHVNERREPAHGSAVDPTAHGWGAWPTDSDTFVPGNLDGLKQTWRGIARPVESLSCDSPAGGDWLRVEVWTVDKAFVVKLYTDWN